MATKTKVNNLNRSRRNIKNSGQTVEAEEFKNKLSADEYRDTYDLQDPEVFMQQGKQLDDLTDCLTLYRLMLNITGAQNPSDHWKTIDRWSQESNYFKEELKTRIQSQ